MTAEQKIREIIELQKHPAAKLQALKNTHTFAEDWPVLGEVLEYMNEVIEVLDEYAAKWKGKESG